MGNVADLFVPNGKVELKISDLQDLFRSDALSWAQNTCMINGLKANLPAEHILIMIGETEEDKNESKNN